MKSYESLSELLTSQRIRHTDVFIEFLAEVCTYTWKCNYELVWGD